MLRDVILGMLRTSLLCNELRQEDFIWSKNKIVSLKMIARNGGRVMGDKTGALKRQALKYFRYEVFGRKEQFSLKINFLFVFVSKRNRKNVNIT